MYTASIVSAVQDPDASVARITIEYFKDGSYVGQLVYRTGEPGTIPHLVANEIAEFQRKDDLVVYLANPPLGPIEPETPPVPTDDELAQEALYQKVAQLQQLNTYVTLGLISPDDPSIAQVKADATTAYQAVPLAAVKTKQTQGVIGS